jgi:hypothetical protein
LAPAVSAISLAAVRVPAALQREQLWSPGFDQGGASELASDPIEPDAPVQGAGGDLQLGPEVVQVPAQATLVLRAGLDQVLAVIEQELDLQGVLVEVGARQRLSALAQGRAGDRKGIDRVRLAGAPFAATALAHQLRGNPHHPLSRGDQEALQGTGDVAAVLDCPGPLFVEVASPVE